MAAANSTTPKSSSLEWSLKKSAAGEAFWSVSAAPSLGGLLDKLHSDEIKGEARPDGTWFFRQGEAVKVRIVDISNKKYGEEDAIWAEVEVLAETAECPRTKPDEACMLVADKVPIDASVENETKQFYIFYLKHMCPDFPFEVGEEISVCEDRFLHELPRLFGSLKPDAVGVSSSLAARSASQAAAAGVTVGGVIKER